MIFYKGGEKIIIIDDREPSYISNKLPDAKIERLEIGDYIIGNMIIERKSSSDFISSILDGRLFRQLNNMQDLEFKPVLAIIGNIWRPFADSKMNYGSQMVFGVFKSIILDFNTPIIQFDAENDFVSFLKKCDEENKDKRQLRLPHRKGKTLQEQKVFALSNIEGVSVKKAELLLNNFGSLKGVLNASKKDLLSIDGIGRKLASNVIEFFI